MQWLKENFKSILWILIAIAALFLLYVLLWPKPVPTSHDAEKKMIDSLNTIIIDLKSTSYAKITKDSSRAAIAEKKADSSINEKKIWEARAKVNEANAKYYALKYQTERDKGDSGQAFAACDQLIQIVDSQSMVINTLRSIGDSIDLQRQIHIIAQDSTILNQKALIQATENAFQTQNKAYNGLFKDYNKQVKANKTNRTLSRILAATTLVLGLILIAK